MRLTGRAGRVFDRAKIKSAVGRGKPQALPRGAAVFGVRSGFQATV